MPIIRFFLYLIPGILLLVVLAGCSESLKYENKGIQVAPTPSGSYFPSLVQPEGKRVITRLDNSRHTVYWTRFAGVYEDFSFSAPRHWKLEQEDSMQLVLACDSLSKDYFALTINEKIPELQTAAQYADWILEQVDSDFCGRYHIVEERLMKSGGRDIIYKKLEASPAEPTFYLVFTDNDGYLFDFTYRVMADREPLANMLFHLVMHSFEFNGVQVMEGGEGKVSVSVGRNNT